MGLLDFLGKGSSSGLTIDETLMALSKGAVLIDVRTQNEYEAGHAPGARPVNPKALKEDPIEAIHGDDILADRDAAIVVMCDNGLRSGLVARSLRERGILAESVAGGLYAWGRAGNPILPGPYRRRR
ncbi:rhodanese-like domain-containing protein [Tessaracoccus sp. OH4464_COT-324]|uniref:rhodanese-like domain-containing protein n=1 Tax=Tessaracoccus sp. OH4464_COT-324 TaxID=2491059 RepID=UPI000F6388D9|nr:rhodanese-like domain-containing protein [Tessaracoccus sp. OH4464_COT-324]RRD45221.1 rhodanese-like domain-containing protein [Tessaracoccus sp. OH4464_COT-324]